MDSLGVPESLVTALYVLIPLLIAAIAVWRGEGARSQQAEGITRARTRRTYCFFIPWAAFVIVAAVVGIVSPDWVELVGILGGPLAAILAVIALFHALMVWRVPLIMLLLLATGIAAVVLACIGFLPNPWISAIDPWIPATAIAYGIFVLGVSVRGLVGLRMPAGSNART